MVGERLPILRFLDERLRETHEIFGTLDSRCQSGLFLRRKILLVDFSVDTKKGG